MKNKRGFTLVELLAVIVILAVIALIASALILNVIDTAKKGALEDSAYGIIEAGELYYMNNLSANNDVSDRYDFKIVNKKFVNTEDPTKTLSFKGKMPKTGTLQINSNGSVAIAICDDDYCACKSVSENKVTVKDTSCNMSSETGEIENGSTVSSAEIEELKKDIEELKKSQGAVTGTVISYMGNNVPNGYLACDGTVYNISDYKNLAEQIKTEFGSYNYFGGDGTTTFAVPDLRGEFLRGTGTNSHANQGNGADVGKHQDATNDLNFYVGSQTELWIDSDKNRPIKNMDSVIDFDTSIARRNYYSRSSVSNDNIKYGDNGTYYTSRPTNTSVLYCIKY